MPDRLRQMVEREALSGLRAEPKTLPPKLFYDAEGARLFERLCLEPEYYVTRTELAILQAALGEIAEQVGPRAALIEYGSGAGLKVRLLLGALESPAAYVPIDISCEQLELVASEISASFPGVDVTPLCADFTQPIRLPSTLRRTRPVAFFPGSTIGNFHPTEAAAFLRRVRRTLGPGGTLILGIDRVKDQLALERAYDDAAGVTAAFNLNMLARLNRDIDATFDLAAFSHRAVWNAAASRIEMHLVSRCAQTISVAGAPIHFAEGETIWTECSYKYDDESLAVLAEGGGFAIERRWTDRDDRFWVVLLRVPAATTGR